MLFPLSFLLCSLSHPPYLLYFYLPPLIPQIPPSSPSFPSPLIRFDCSCPSFRPSHPSPPLPDVECGELSPLVERLHSGSARLHRAAAAGRLGAGGLPSHRDRRHRGEEPGRKLPGALPHAQHPPADPQTALVQAPSRAHGHRGLPALQVRLGG